MRGEVSGRRLIIHARACADLADVTAWPPLPGTSRQAAQDTTRRGDCAPHSTRRNRRAVDRACGEADYIHTHTHTHTHTSVSTHTRVRVCVCVCVCACVCVCNMIHTVVRRCQKRPERRRVTNGPSSEANVTSPVMPTCRARSDCHPSHGTQTTGGQGYRL